ncbi:MAG: serine protease [Bryobacterales bacterium]|nr:serine protease [Bryobacterales bacterium]
MNGGSRWREITARLALCFSVSICVCSAQEQDHASKVYAESSKSVLLLIARSEGGQVVGQSSGFVIAGGKIVTNEHVVRAGNILVDLGAAKLPVTVERVDAANDLAILTSTVELSVAPLPISEAMPTPGTNVYALGNPAGLEKSISTGVVSGVRDFKGRQLLQITAPISPGSSGGPILNARGEVVGVAVGILELGQNLNFAVPATVLRKLILGKTESSGDAVSLLQRIQDLTQTRGQYQFSLDPDSDWQKLDRQIDDLLENALQRAGSDSALLLRIAGQAQTQNTDIAIRAAEQAIRIRATPEANLALAKCLQFKATFSEDADRSALLQRAENAARAAVRGSKLPGPDLYYQLAGILEDRGSYVEAETNFRRALDLSRTDTELKANSIRRLIRIADALGKQSEGDTWFAALVGSGQATAEDWETDGWRHFWVRHYHLAGLHYQEAASSGGHWTNWCQAAISFALAEAWEDRVLACARKCIEEGAGKNYSESVLANAHYLIAAVLNQRGVFQEALSHAREATALKPTEPWYYDAQAKALSGLRRFQEAINASDQAIRLSDGKYSTMHFTLGGAYFDVENWEFARQSFEKAAQLNPKDDAAPYNVALCLVRLRYYRDAANWYEEVLRRNPNRRDRQEILSRIQILRR